MQWWTRPGGEGRLAAPVVCHLACRCLPGGDTKRGQHRPGPACRGGCPLARAGLVCCQRLGGHVARAHGRYGGWLCTTVLPFLRLGTLAQAPACMPHTRGCLAALLPCCRLPGIDPSDFFNFGMTERGWRDYCARVAQYRLEFSMKGQIQVGARCAFACDADRGAGEVLNVLAVPPGVLDEGSDPGGRCTCACCTCACDVGWVGSCACTDVEAIIPRCQGRNACLLPPPVRSHVLPRFPAPTRRPWTRQRQPGGGLPMAAAQQRMVWLAQQPAAAWAVPAALPPVRT